MSDVYTTDFTSAAHVRIKGKKYAFKRIGRDEFKRSLLHGHINIMERLVSKNIIIDTEKKIAGASAVFRTTNWVR